MLLTLFFCFALAPTQSEAQPETGTGLEGEIRIGPIHGGPTRIGVPDSKPLANTAERENQKQKISHSLEAIGVSKWYAARKANSSTGVRWSCR
jgi:hypothetical protein